MKVILQADVKGLGKRGSVLEVADGHARNYLIPRKLAIAATTGGVKQVENVRSQQTAAESHRLELARATARKLGELSVRISARAGEHGRLYGSITAKQVAAELQKQHRVLIDKHDLHVQDPIRALGQHVVEVSLHAQVKATLRVEIVCE